jgi:glycine cleavage system aminomethyltransferase T
VSEPITDVASPSRIDVPPLRSPLSTEHTMAEAVTTIEGGAEVLRSYGDLDAERTFVNGTVGLADITVRSKIDFRGEPEQAYVSATDDLLAKIALDWWVVFAPPGPVIERVASMTSLAGRAAMVTDVTHLYAGFALAGPALPDVIARLSSWDPATLEPGAATGAPIADVRAVVVRRTIDVPTLDIYVAMECARYVWRSILPVVERCRGGPVGWDALREEGWR